MRAGTCVRVVIRCDLYDVMHPCQGIYVCRLCSITYGCSLHQSDVTVPTDSDTVVIHTPVALEARIT